MELTAATAKLIGKAALFLGLAACEPVVASLPPSTAPDPGALTAPAAFVPASDVSKSLSKYYANVETGLISQGLLRSDSTGLDVPFSSRDLVDNFIRIALFEEYTNIGGRIVAQETASQLHRWEKPIRMNIEFGASVPLEQRAMDRANITEYAARLGRITGLPVQQTSRNANYYVFVVNEDERKELGPQIRTILPGIEDAAVRAVTNMPRTTFCLVFAWDPQGTGEYSRSVAVIRGEHPDLMRLSCIHEELAQGLGLSNDSPSARPSVFNDDEEFGLLTGQDELLLKMLYDGRMRPGMNVAQARQQAEIIAAELLDGDS